MSGVIRKSDSSGDKRFSKREFLDLLAQLKPVFEESGFRCYDDGSHGGFSIIEGSIHWASYGLCGNAKDGTWLQCSIKATRREIRLVMDDYENARGSGKFTATKEESAAISLVIQSINKLLQTRHPNTSFEVTDNRSSIN
jgi:hypothetical protein